MTRALDKHRIAVKYGDGLDTLIFGDSSEDAKLYSGMVSELSQTAGATAAKKLEKKPAPGTPGAAGGAPGGQPAPLPTQASGGMPTWGYVALGLGGVAVLGLGLYAMRK